MNKILAASTSDIEYQIAGGCHVVTLNPGMYESFKAALPDFYDPDYCANVNYHIILKNTVVDVMHQVLQKRYNKQNVCHKFV